MAFWGLRSAIIALSWLLLQGAGASARAQEIQPTLGHYLDPKPTEPARCLMDRFKDTWQMGRRIGAKVGKAVLHPSLKVGAPLTLLATARSLSEKSERPRDCSFDAERWIDLEAPNRSCEAKIGWGREIIPYYRHCLDKTFMDQRNSREAVIARREQLKLLYGQEIFYLGRIAPAYWGYELLWNEFRARWRARLEADPEVVKLDLSTEIGEDRCALVSRVYSRSCSVAFDDKKQAVVALPAATELYSSGIHLSDSSLQSTGFRPEAWRQYASMWNGDQESGDPAANARAQAALEAWKHYAVGETDPVSYAKNETYVQLQVRGTQSQVPVSLGHDLLRSAFMLDSLQPHDALKPYLEKRLRRIHDPARAEVDIKFHHDYIYNYFPELALDPALHDSANAALAELGPIDGLRKRFVQEWEAGLPQLEREIAQIRQSGAYSPEARGPLVNQLMLAQRMEIVDRIIKRQLELQDGTDRLILNQALAKIDERFLASWRKVQDPIDAQVKLGREDPHWLFRQEYLYQPAMAAIVGSPVAAASLPKFQAALCGTQADARAQKEQVQTLQTYGTLSMLLPMIGTFKFAGTVIGEVSAYYMMTLGLGMSYFDFHNAQREYERNKDLFVISAGEAGAQRVGGSHSRMTAARNSRNESAAFGLLNALQMVPNVAMNRTMMRFNRLAGTGNPNAIAALQTLESRIRMMNRATDGAFVWLNLYLDNNVGLAGAILQAGQGEIIGRLMARRAREAMPDPLSMRLERRNYAPAPIPDELPELDWKGRAKERARKIGEFADNLNPFRSTGVERYSITGEAPWMPSPGPKLGFGERVRELAKSVTESLGSAVDPRLAMPGVDRHPSFNFHSAPGPAPARPPVSRAPLSLRLDPSTGARMPGLWSEEFRAFMRGLPDEQRIVISEIWATLPSGRIGNTHSFRQRAASLAAGRIAPADAPQLAEQLRKRALYTLSFDPDGAAPAASALDKVYKTLRRTLGDPATSARGLRHLGLPEEVARAEGEAQWQAVDAAYRYLRGL